MSYIGKTPTVGNFQVCDAISTVNGQASYTMQVDSVNVVPESANHMLVSLNGILQKAGSSFTVSSSVITFASNLVTGDVIDFIQILGNVLDLGVPSDATVTNAKTNFVSTSSASGLQIKGDGTTDGTLQLNCSQNSHGIKLKSPPHSASASYTLTFPNNDGDANQVLTTDGSGVLSFADAGGGEWTKILHTTISSSTSLVAFNSTYITSTYQDYKVVYSNVHCATDQTHWNLYASADNGSNFLGWDYANNGVKDDGNHTVRFSNDGGVNFRLHQSENIGNATGESISGFIEMFDPSATDTRTHFLGKSAYNLGASANAHASASLGGATQSTSAVNYIKFQFTTGNIESGEFTLYGRKIT